MSQTTNLGKVCVTPKGTHNPAITYAILDIVTDNGSSYIAIKDVPVNIAITNTSYWQCIAAKGSTGEITEVTASISGGYGTPAVEVTEGGTSTEKTLAFAFENLVGSGISSIVGEKTGTSGNVDTYTLTITYESGDTDTVTYTVTNGSVTSVNGMTGDVKIDKVELSDNFDSKMVLTDNSGYLYRTTGGALEVGEQNRVKKIIGTSVPIIQKLKSSGVTTKTLTSYGVEFTLSADGTVTANGTITGASVSARPSFGLTELHSGNPLLESGHVYWLKKVMLNNTSICANGQKFGGIVFNNWGYEFNIENAGLSSHIVKPDSNINNNLSLTYIVDDNSSAKDRFHNGDVIHETFKICVIDLTTTFSTTVANRIYALEQAQAGTGIAKTKEILVKDYYPYNETAFTHTKTSGKVNNGFNQFDKSKATAGYYVDDASGALTPNAGFNASDYIELSKQTNLYHNTGGISVGVWLAFYDENKTYISGIGSHASGVLPQPANAKYIRITVPNDKLDVTCLNFHWDGERDGEYEDYQEWNYPVQDIELKGILLLDVSDNWYSIVGDEYPPSGEFTNNMYELAFDGTEAWSFGSENSDYIRFSTQMVKPIASASYNNRNNFDGTRWKQGINVSSADSMENILDIRSNIVIINISKAQFTGNTPEQFATYMSGKTFIYEVETPTQTSADSYTELQNDSNWGTEKWIDTRDVPMPVFSTCEYIPDLKAKLETAPESPEEDGDYIMHRENGLNSYAPLSTYLSGEGYNKTVDLSSEITDIAGLTYNAKKAYKTGNVVTIMIVGVNSTGTDIPANTVLFNLGSNRPYAHIRFSGTIGTSLVEFLAMSNNGDVSCVSGIPNNQAINIALSYII